MQQTAEYHEIIREKDKLYNCSKMRRKLSGCFSCFFIFYLCSAHGRAGRSGPAPEKLRCTERMYRYI